MVCVINPFEFASIVVLTGAGISAESGLQTFRGSGGLWEGRRVQEVATPEAFARDPTLVHKFYNARRRQLVATAQPNAAHRALAGFQRAFRGNFLLVTQNVDNLHEQGGSEGVLHMHGELLKARCVATAAVFSAPLDIDVETPCPCCRVAGNVRPHVVWFGEMPLHMAAIEAALQGSDLFIAIGTSGQVYPAAGFVQLAKAAGATTVELNLEPSEGHSYFDHAHYGRATDMVAEFFAAH